MFIRLPLLAMTAMALPGCAGQVPPEPDAGPSPVRLLSLPASGIRMEAALSGRLLLDSGCAQVERRSGRVSVVWSGAAEVDPTGAVLYQGRRFAHGEQVRFGGGFVTGADEPALQPRIATAQCPGPYFFVQSVEDPRP